MESYEIKKLVDKAQKQDRDSFGRLFDEYYKPIFGYVLKRVANVDLAQDLTSETFFKALKYLPKFEWRTENSFANWLFRIATNEINLHFRKWRNTLSINDENLNLPDRIPAPEETLPDYEIIQAQTKLERKETYIKVQKEMAKLKTEYQTVLTLKYFEKKKIEEICQILKKPEGTVKSWIHRGMENLRKLLEQNATI